MKLVPRFLSVLLLLLLVCASAFADTMYVFCRPKDYVRVRESPTTSTEVVGYLDCGDPVETTGEMRKDKQGRKWLRIAGLENGGWVCAMYLSDSPVTITDGYAGYVVSNGRTALRRSPNGKRIKWLNNGAEFRVYAMTDEWVLCKGGYIKRECVEVYYGTVE